MKRILQIGIKILFLVLVSNQIFGQSSCLDILLDLNNVACKSDSSGSASVTVKKGNSPYKFLWSTSDTLDFVDSLTVGNYSITVSDSNGCIDSMQFEINEPKEELKLSFRMEGDFCIGLGWVFCTANGGTPPYNYSWSNGSSNNVIPVNKNNDYDLTVTDANGCTIMGSSDIPFECPWEATAFVNHVSCSGGSDGIVNLGYKGCVNSGVSYCISGKNCGSSSYFSDLSAGTYSFLVFTDLCTQSIQVTIEEPKIDTLSYQISELTNVSCHNELGLIDLEGIGGVLPYSYQWDNGSQISLNDSLIPGFYSFTITDSIGCTIFDTIEIASNPLISTGNDTTFNFTCPNNVEPIELIPVFDGPLTNYVFEWTFENGNILSNGNFSSLKTDSIGTYIFTALDTINNCSFSDSIHIYNNINYNPDTITSSPIFKNSADSLNNGSINPGIHGGEKPYSYHWNSGSTNSEISNLNPGNYILSITDSNGCTETFTYQIDNVTSTINIASDSLKVSPNPSLGLFKLNCEACDFDFHHIKIYDSLGNFIIEKQLDPSSKTIDLRGLLNGVYFISVESKDGKKLISKIIVAK